ncbi:uncharacterized protein BKA55DRAFT_587325 [Fusarium redolens]|uniref:Uncharacterized protein n=1 Tax=Fusarium redolens TaxID=48865 RepID=A0A9P9FW97_FUSRE|nr:uncharacterized protein BKA55DRAFT_587325 [Fusarium redolens]KAH7205125.1 hypothetical protein BKA55DRAFT_587325 [Fusarium redolens]
MVESGKENGVRWRQGHNETEPVVAERQVAVVPIDELHKYDPEVHSSLVPHSKTVRKFLTGQLAAQSNIEAKRVKLGITNTAGKLEDSADKDRLNSESRKRNSLNGRIAGLYKDIGVMQLGVNDPIQPNAILGSGLLATTDGYGHALVAMSSISGPLPSMQPLLSPVPTLRSTRVARSKHVTGRAKGREAITQPVKLPGNPTLNIRPLQRHQLLSGPESSIPSLSENGLRWALTPPVTSPETNHLPQTAAVHSKDIILTISPS